MNAKNYELSCHGCSILFMALRPSDRFCSNKCRWRVSSREKDKTKKNAWRRAWCKRNRARLSKKATEATSAWRKKSPEASKLIARRALLKHNYGITLEQYEEILEKQNHSCAVCKRHRSLFKKSLAVDHEHGDGPNGGAIRGALCTDCNRAVIGRRKDPQIFHNAAKYLEGPYTGWFVPKRKPKSRKRKSRKK